MNKLNLPENKTGNRKDYVRQKIRKDFLERFSMLKKHHQMSNSDVAREVGSAASVIINVDNGSRFPSVVELAMFASLFNVSADYLIGLADSPIVVDELLISIEEHDNMIDRLREIPINFGNNRADVVGGEVAYE